MERNAPRANLVERAELWRWTSLCAGRKESNAEILSAWPVPRPANWIKLVNQPQTEAELASLRQCVKRGTPFGEPDWVEDTATRLGLATTLRPRGRPKKTTAE